MTPGFLDTNILVGFLKGDKSIRRALDRFDPIMVPATTYAEFMVGMKTEEKIAASDKAITSLFEIVHSTKEICLEAAAIRRRTGMKLPDAMIYATARVEGGTLITLDKDFDKSWPDVYIPE